MKGLDVEPLRDTGSCRSFTSPSSGWKSPLSVSLPLAMLAKLANRLRAVELDCKDRGLQLDGADVILFCGSTRPWMALG